MVVLLPELEWSLADLEFLTCSFEVYNLNLDKPVLKIVHRLRTLAKVYRLPEREESSLQRLLAHAKYNYLHKLPPRVGLDSRVSLLNEKNELTEISYNRASKTTTSRIIYSFPEINTPKTYPSIAYSSGYTCVSSGDGQVVILKYKEDSNDYICAFKLNNSEFNFVISNFLKWSEDEFLAIGWNSANRDTQNNKGKIFAASFYSFNKNTNELVIRSSLLGKSFPQITAIDPYNSTWILGNSFPFFSSNEEINEPKTSGPELEQPYYWMQTEEDIEITVKLHNKNAKDISCIFMQNNIRCTYIRKGDHSCGEELLFSDNILYDKILPHECLWSLENNSVLSLHLFKQNVGTSWPHVFEIDDDVHQTRDPMVFAEIVRSMDKYTTEEESKFDPLYKVTNERLEEVDVPKIDAIITSFEPKQNPKPINYAHLVNQEIFEYIPNSASRENLLQSDKCVLGKFVINEGIDANTYEIVCSKDSSISLVHVESHSALGYIKNSKLDAKYLLFTDNLAAIIENKKYVHIYMKPKANACSSVRYTIEIIKEECSGNSIIGASEEDNVIYLLLEDQVVVLDMEST